MATFDLSQYDLPELKGLLFDIDQELRRREHAGREQAREQIRALAESVGLSVEQVLQPARPRYRNPADAAQTWSGRGRQPKWLSEQLAGGRSLDEFEG